MQLQSGEFVGQTVESTIPYFWSRVKRSDIKGSQYLTAFTLFEGQNIQKMLQANFKRVRSEVEQIIKQHHNIYK